MKRYQLYTIALYYFVLLFLASPSSRAQNCYVQMDDASGFDASPYQAALEAKACELKTIFDTIGFLDSFKVYSFGFYLDLEYYDGYSYPNAFLDIKEEIEQESFSYLLIGRQTDHTGLYTKFWVKLKLPTEENFSCFESDFYDMIEFQVTKAISDKYDSLGNSPVQYSFAEIEGINKLKDWVTYIVDCCDPDPESRTTCSLCSWTDQDVFDYLSQNEFELFDCSISESLPNIDSLCLCSTDYETQSQNLVGNTYELDLVTNLNSFSIDNQEINISSLYSNLEELGKLYGEEGKSFYGAITDQSVFCSTEPEVALKSSNGIPTLNEISQKLNAAETGIWISITYTNSAAKCAISTRGIDLLIEDSGVNIFDILEFIGTHLEKSPIEVLNEGYYYGHFHPLNYKFLYDKIKFVHGSKEWGIPRAEYIDQIDAIQQYLERRRSEYGEAAQYLKDLLPLLILQEEFTTPEVYYVYLYAYSWYEECLYMTLSLVVSEVIKAVKPFIEFALIESGFLLAGQVFSITANASWRLTSLLPQSVKNTAQLIWNRIIFSSAYRSNTLIPETFKITTQSGEQVYVQYSGTKHMAEMVTKNGAVLKPWYESQKGLRSQLVLDDFARAVDDIYAGNATIIANGEKIYTSGKWEIIFNQPIPTSNGLITIFHAVPKIY